MLKEPLQRMAEKRSGLMAFQKKNITQILIINLKQLVEKLKNKSYRPKPARKVEIPKENGKTRPLSIYSYEDKLVQEALMKVWNRSLSPISTAICAASDQTATAMEL